MVAEGPAARHSARIDAAKRPRPAQLNILALDTSTDYCSVALVVNGEPEVREARAGQDHSSRLLGMIDEALRARGIALQALDAIAYGEGPGSFTGLRIACGVVQGLAFGSGVPVVGIGTLLAMAAGTASDRVVCCVDARIAEIYHAAYERTPEGWHAVHEPSLCTPAEAPSLLGAGWHACGSGFAAYREVLEARYAGKLAAVEADRYPHARDIAALASPLVARGEVRAAEAAAPVYLRDKVALRIDERANR
jgi:tRNA threonylcarbamoyladenosine biosynthesis protein TsaB